MDAIDMDIVVWAAEPGPREVCVRCSNSLIHRCDLPRFQLNHLVAVFCHSYRASSSTPPVFRAVARTMEFGSKPTGVGAPPKV